VVRRCCSTVINLAIIESSRTVGDVLSSRLAAETTCESTPATSRRHCGQANEPVSAVDVHVVYDDAVFGLDHADPRIRLPRIACRRVTRTETESRARAPPADAAVVLLCDYHDRRLLCPAIPSPDTGIGSQQTLG